MRRQKRFDLGSEAAFEHFSVYRQAELKAGKKFIWTRSGDNRNNRQNALSFAIYGQIAGQLEDQTVADVRAECKLNNGVPILRRDDEDFDDMYSNSIGLLAYEDQLRAMKWLQVTSEFTKDQFSEYVDTVIREYSMQGISIIFPGER